VVPHVRGASRRRDRTKRPTVPVARDAAQRAGGDIKPGVIVIGASTGGPGAVRTVLAGLGTDLPVPVVVVQHMAEEFADGFVRWLDSQVPMPVREATPRTRMRRGHAYVAVRGPHIAIGADGVIAAVDGPPAPHCPSIDVLFSSVAQAWSNRAVGILLTGMGDDGAAGLGDIASSGGLTIVQDEETSVVFGMPGAAIERGAARWIVGLDSVARLARDICKRS
jgi:two-component system chemotaxis response regulator CheB